MISIKLRSLINTFLILTMCIACIILEMTTHILTSPFTGYLHLLRKRRISINDSATDSLINDNFELLLTDEQEDLNTLRVDGVTRSLARLRFDKFTYRQLSLTCHSYLDNTNTVCNRKLRMGNIGDGGWEICDDRNVRPQPPCIIYSFGIADDFSFDDETSRWYKCHVFSFDPTISQKSHNRSEFIHFYDIGISGRTHNDSQLWLFNTFSDTRKYLGHELSHISVVKMDVEGAEWESIAQMLKKNELRNVDQFLVEYHIQSVSRTSLTKYLQVLQDLEYAGFRIYYTHKNEGCGYHVNGYPPITSKCFEVHYKKLLTRKG